MDRGIAAADSATTCRQGKGMTMETSDRIALFQYEWPLQVHAMNLALKLAESGYQVDIFLKDCRTGFVVPGEQREKENITVYDLSRPLRQVRRIVRYLLGKAWFIKKHLPLIAPAARQDALKRLGTQRYRCFIGVEKKGLIWAGILAQVLNVPFLYYSLELYLEDVPAFAGDKGFPVLRREEIKYHRLSSATIIQDRLRASALLRSNGIEKTDVLLLPVTFPDGENRNRSTRLYDQNNIPRHAKLILYFGMISEDRRCIEVAEAARHLKENRLLVFHGFGPRRDIIRLRSRGKYPNTVLSLKKVPQAAIKDIIASAAIGLVLYENCCDNDRLTAFSSEKIALYLQSGIPIIAFDMGNYRELTDAYRCGELITDVRELPGAVEKILDDYDQYRERAFAAYRDLYRYETYFPAIRKYLDAL
jgi:glycosyltransferase involved in cell wall biosynthesis